MLPAIDQWLVGMNALTDALARVQEAIAPPSAIESLQRMGAKRRLTFKKLPQPRQSPSQSFGAVRRLGTTKYGSPRHPLYVRGDAPLIPWGVPS